MGTTNHLQGKGQPFYSLGEVGAPTFTSTKKLEDDFYVSLLHSQQFQLVDDLYLFIYY